MPETNIKNIQAELWQNLLNLQQVNICKAIFIVDRTFCQ